MSDFRKRRPDWDWDWDCDKKDWDWDCRKKEVIIVEKEKDFKKDCCIKGPRHPKPKEVLLFCGKGINIDKERVPKGDVSIPIGRVSVDTSCLCKPLVKIDFSTIIEVEDGNPPVDLTIALKRTCNGGDSIELETYELKFEDTDDGAVIPFSFTFCDNDFCQNGCCIYTVEIIKIKLGSGLTLRELETESTAINAIAQGLCD